jgi:hypothetical protein
MQNGKSRQIDGMHSEILRTLRDIIGDDFNHLDSSAFASRCLLESINQGLIKIILKNVASDTIEQWKPINLLSVAYKIIAKAC